MKTFVLLVVLLMQPLTAAAAGFLVRWEHPTRNTDNRLISENPDFRIVETIVEWGSCVDGDKFGAADDGRVVPAPDQELLVDGLEEGRYCVRAFSKNALDIKSSESKAKPYFAR